jgi:hypothetical protein
VCNSGRSTKCSSGGGYTRLTRHLLFSITNLLFVIGVGTLSFAYFEKKPWWGLHSSNMVVKVTLIEGIIVGMIDIFSLFVSRYADDQCFLPSYFASGTKLFTFLW